MCTDRQILDVVAMSGIDEVHQVCKVMLSNASLCGEDDKLPGDAARRRHRVPVGSCDPLVAAVVLESTGHCLQVRIKEEQQTVRGRP